MEAPSRSPRLMFALTAVLATAQLFRPTLVCDTTVAIGDGKIAIELRDDWAPNGAKRLTELAVRTLHDAFELEAELLKGSD